MTSAAEDNVATSARRLNECPLRRAVPSDHQRISWLQTSSDGSDGRSTALANGFIEYRVFRIKFNRSFGGCSAAGDFIGGNKYKKLCYRRESARRRSFRRSRSFKVTDFGNNRKPVCQLSRSIDRIIPLNVTLSYCAKIISIS